MQVSVSTNTQSMIPATAMAVVNCYSTCRGHKPDLSSLYFEQFRLKSIYCTVAGTTHSVVIVRYRQQQQVTKTTQGKQNTNNKNKLCPCFFYDAIDIKSGTMYYRSNGFLLGRI
jgi:hypothetical protein